METVLEDPKLHCSFQGEHFQLIFFSKAILKLLYEADVIEQILEGKGEIGFSFLLTDSWEGCFTGHSSSIVLLIPFIFSSSVYSIGILKSKLETNELIVHKILMMHLKLIYSGSTFLVMRLKCDSFLKNPIKFYKMKLNIRTP